VETEGPFRGRSGKERPKQRNGKEKYLKINKKTALTWNTIGNERAGQQFETVRGEGPSLNFE